MGNQDILGPVGLLWLRLLTVIGVASISVYLGARVSTEKLSSYAFLALGAVPLLLIWPTPGLFALLVASLVSPFVMGTGTQTNLNATVLLLIPLVAVWGLDLLLRRDVRILRSRPVLPLLAFVSVAILAFLLGGTPLLTFARTAPLAAQLGGLAVFLLSAGAFLMAGQQLRDVRWLKWLTWLFLALGALYLAGRLAPQAVNFIPLRFQPGADGSLFWVWLAALAFAQAVYNRELGIPWRAALMGLVIMLLYVGFFRERAWTSGWLPPLASLLFVLLVGSPRLAPLAVAPVLLVMVLNSHLLPALVMVGDNQYSLDTRLEAWQIMGGIVGASPWLGLGPANYYWYTPLYSLDGYHVSFNSHNNYIDVVAQTGILGAACLLWFFWELARLGWSLRTRVAAGFGRAYVYGALGGLGGTLVAGMLGDWFLPFVYNIGLQGFRASALGWLFLGGLVALEQSLTSSPHPRPPVG